MGNQLNNKDVVNVISENELDSLKNKNKSKLPSEKKLRYKGKHRFSRGAILIYFIFIIIIIILSNIIAIRLLLPVDNEINEKSEDIGPKIRIIPGSHDLDSIAQISVNRTFKIENVGDKPLNITGISTSCGCTSALLFINGETSPRFGRNNNPIDWMGEIDVGKSADLIVTYDAGLHPDSGHIKRVIFIKSNDHSLSEARITLTAFVVE
jgi:hypothetical protein